MKYEEKRICVKDKFLLHLFEDERAAENGMSIMAQQAKQCGERAWKLAAKLYGFDSEKDYSSFDPKTKTITWKEFDEADAK